MTRISKRIKAMFTPKTKTNEKFLQKILEKHIKTFDRVIAAQTKLENKIPKKKAMAKKTPQHKTLKQRAVKIGNDVRSFFSSKQKVAINNTVVAKNSPESPIELNQNTQPQRQQIPTLAEATSPQTTAKSKESFEMLQLQIQKTNNFKGISRMNNKIKAQKSNLSRQEIQQLTKAVSAKRVGIKNKMHQQIEQEKTSRS